MIKEIAFTLSGRPPSKPQSLSTFKGFGRFQREDLRNEMCPHAAIFLLSSIAF